MTTIANAEDFKKIKVGDRVRIEGTIKDSDSHADTWFDLGVLTIYSDEISAITVEMLEPSLQKELEELPTGATVRVGNTSESEVDLVKTGKDSWVVVDACFEGKALIYSSDTIVKTFPDLVIQ